MPWSPGIGGCSGGKTLRYSQDLTPSDAHRWWAMQMSAIATRKPCLLFFFPGSVLNSIQQWALPGSKPAFCYVLTARNAAGPWCWLGRHSALVMTCLFFIASADNLIQINDYTKKTKTKPEEKTGICGVWKQISAPVNFQAVKKHFPRAYHLCP